MCSLKVSIDCDITTISDYVKLHLVADTLSRDICCSLSTESQLVEFHGSLCHPGVSRMAHFVRSRNLPYSVEDIRRVTSSCTICAKTKPQYFKPDKTENAYASIKLTRVQNMSIVAKNA